MRPAARRLIAALVLALVATACGGGSDDPNDDVENSSARLNLDAELRIGFTEDQYILEGPDANLGAYPANTNVVETLVYLNDRYEVVPRLAESWEFRAPNTWRFHLRRGVRFHDGQAVNAQTIKTGLFDRVAAKRNGGTIRATPQSAVVVDDYTIDYTASVPNLRVVEQLVHPQNGAIAPGSDHGTKPVGTGPFRFVDYRPKERITVERNEDYWGEKALLRRLTFRFFPDRNARLLALQAGDIDLAYEIPRDDVAGLESRGFTIAKSTVGAYRAIFMNSYGDEPYDILRDVNVRKAIAMGIDRKKHVDGVLSGLATTDQTFVPPAALGAAASVVKGHTYNLNEARRLLDNAGWRAGSDGIRVKDGRRLKLELVSGFPSAEVIRPSPTFLQAELKNLGIELEIVERPDSASFQDLMGRKQGDLFIEDGNQNDANVGFLPVLLLYTGAGSSGTGVYQGISAPGPRFNQLIEPALTEPDHARLQQIVATAMNEAITEQTTVMPLNGVFRIYGMKSSVTGFVPHPSFLNVSWLGVGVTGG
ncbi:MAG TPA: ABC transporter substrate-binding protein [Acidimicrobiales bacterium]